MDRLTSCYFCGTIDDSLGEYPVVPGELYPPDEVQRTVVVCSPCREKLTRVMEPLVEYVESLEGDAPATDPAPVDDGADDAAGAPGPDGVADPVDEPVRADDTDLSGEAADAEEVRGVHGENAAGPLSGSSRAPSGPADRADGRGGRDGGSAADARGSAYTNSRGAGYRWEPDAGDDSIETSGLPFGARKVTRLLENRSFPIERTVAVELVSGAYDLEPWEVRNVLDALIARDLLVERDGMLHHPGGGSTPDDGD